MKKIFTTLLLSLPMVLLAQEIQYCTIIAQEKQLNDKIKKATIDYGNDSIVVLKDVTLADACNYVGKQGYVLITSYARLGDWTNHYLYFKKDIKKEESD